MPESSARVELIRRLREAAERDPHVVGIVDYGSGSEGRADEWSDVDVTLFIRDAELDRFGAVWVSWAAQFGDLLLAYIGQIGHPWAVYDTPSLPLRADFEFQAETAITRLLAWPNSPRSVEAMVLYDGTGGRLTTAVRGLVGKVLRPGDEAAAFTRVCGDFWYYVLYTFSKLQRGDLWVARQAYGSEVLEHLLRLLRLEAGDAALDRWDGASAGVNVERTLSAERQAQLEGCIAAAGAAGLRSALIRAATLGRTVCQETACRGGWDWPRTLAERTLATLTSAGE